MAQYLSADLRIRVIGAVEAGMSRNAAARRFGVSIASAVRWMDEYLRTGRSAPKPRGGDRRSGRIEAQAELLMRAIDATPDITLAELRERLITERGETFALSTIHDFYRRHRITFKKRRRTPASKRARTSPHAARPGSISSPSSTRRSSSSSTRPGPPPRWLGCAGAAPAATDVAPRFRMAIGRPPRWSRACASAASRHP